MNEKKELKKYFKYFIIFIVVVIGYIIFAFFISDKKTISFETKKIIIGGYALLTYENGQWKQEETLDKNFLKEKFSIYDGEEKIDNLELQYVDTSNKWYFFKDNYDEVKPNNFRYAFNGTKDIKPASYKISYFEETDKDILTKYLESKSIASTDFEKGTMKSSVDIDNDGIEEQIFTTTNISLSVTKGQSFAGIFIEKNGKITSIESNEESPYLVREILDIDNDNEYEIIVSKGVVDIPTFDTCYQIYDYKNDKWQVIKECK